MTFMRLRKCAACGPKAAIRSDVGDIAMMITDLKNDVSRNRNSRSGSGTILNLLSIRKAAEYAGVSTSTVRRWIKSGTLKTYRAGKQVRIDEADLIASLSQPKSV